MKTRVVKIENCDDNNDNDNRDGDDRHHQSPQIVQIAGIFLCQRK